MKGCSSQGETIEELKVNLQEALNLYLDEPAKSTVDFPLPAATIDKDNVISVKVDPEIAFALILKKYRHKRHLTQKEFAARVGMRNIFSYQRLERKSNPSLRTIQKIKDVLPDFPIELVF